MKKNVAIIGYGGQGAWHASKILASDVVSLSGVFDIAEKRTKAAQDNGIHTYSSREELLSDTNIDIVVCATPNGSHKEIVIDALRAGKHVVCEKPVALSVGDFDEMCSEAKAAGKVFTVHQNRRWDVDFLAIKSLIDSGEIGESVNIESRIHGSRGIPSDWRCHKPEGGGMILDWGVHLIDQIMYMVPEKVINVFCKMYSVNYPEVDDNLRLTMTFESGLTAHIEVSTNNFIAHPRWYVLGTEGTLQIDDWACNGKVVRCLDREDKWADEIKEVKAGPTKTMAPRSPETVDTIPLSEPTDVIDNLDVVYEQMLDAIEGNAELTIKPEQAMRVMKVMEASFESAEKGIAINCEI